MTKKEAALAYANKGWKIFPCAPNTKVPMVGVKHGVKDASCDRKQIEEWWTQCPDANIGLACGSVSGVWVVDIDIRPETGINGFASAKDAGKEILKTLSQETPSGGRHFIYKCDGEKPANKNGFLKGVDIRGDGYYIVVAPSVINGKPYHWIMDGSEITEFPDAFKPTKRDVQSVFSQPSAPTVRRSNDGERARAYVAEIPGAIEHVDGHAKLFWVAQVLVNGFHLTDDEALDIMWNDYNPRCCPPWDRNGKTEKEFRHKLDEARSKPNAEACSIYESSAYADIKEEEFDFDACIADVRALIYPDKKKDDNNIVIPSVASSHQEAMMRDLITPQGLVGDIAQWMNDTAKCYQPLLSLGAALTLCGAVMGRKVCDESNGRTNIYCMGIGPSSCGKDHPGDCINQILTASGLDSLLMGRMTSDTAIEKALSSHPHVKLAVMDEVGHFFSNINKAGDNASYLKTIKPTLMELFSSAHKTYIGKEKASGNAPHITQPCMCIWGVTVPDKLYSGMTVEELQDGWIARNLIFIAPDKIPDVVIKPHAEVPESIINQIRAWGMRSSLNPTAIITADPGGCNSPMVVPMDERAKKRFDAFNEHTRCILRECHDNGDKTQYLWGKCLQNARRIALIVACGKEFENPTIGYYEADYGCRLTEFLVKNAIAAIEGNVSNTPWEREKMKILSIVSNAGKKGLLKRDIIRKTQYIRDKKVRDLYIEDLIDGGFVECEVIENPGKRPRVIYRTTEAAKKLELENGVEHMEVD